MVSILHAINLDATIKVKGPLFKTRASLYENFLLPSSWVSGLISSL